MATTLLYMYTESPLHAGTGSTVSVIDLPIQRERTTNYPHVYGSGIKGALRSQSALQGIEEEIVFGPDPESMQGNRDRQSFAGGVSVGEARLVLFPVRSLTGIFAYVTCPFVLARLRRDLSFAGVNDLPELSSSLQANSQCMVAPAATGDGGVARSDAVVLEEYTFNTDTDESISNLATWLSNNAMPSGDEYRYWRDTLPQRLVVIPDDAFRDFVTYSTQIATRIRIQKDTKTVKDGALWTQETLPPDALLVSTVVANALKIDSLEINRTDQEVAGLLVGSLPQRIQIGGDETTGHGMVALKWHA